MRSIAIAVLNYNGVSHLEHLLPTLAKAVEVYERPCRVIVLDNQSTAHDREWLAATHPWVRVEVAKRNAFLFSYNELLTNLDEEVVILLNNDMRVKSDFIAPLLSKFEDSSIFSVAACCRNWSGDEVQNGPALLLFHHGSAHCVYDLANQQLCYTLFAGGGCAAFDRRKFLDLGGFDPLFYPAYGEDLDLCFRAWARGWKSLYEPRSVLYHRESGTLSGKARHHMIRAQFLFQWRNLHRLDLRVQRALYTLWQRRVVAKQDAVWQSAYAEAAANWKQRKRAALAPRPRNVSLRALCSQLGSAVV